MGYSKLSSRVCEISVLVHIREVRDCNLELLRDETREELIRQPVILQSTQCRLFQLCRAGAGGSPLPASHDASLQELILSVTQSSTG